PRKRDRTQQVLSRNRAQMPATQQPLSATERDRGQRGPPLPPDLVDRAEGGGDTRQFRDEAPFRQADRDHAGPRRRAGGDPRRSPSAPLPALPPRGGALHAGDAEGAGGGFPALA